MWLKRWFNRKQKKEERLPDINTWLIQHEENNDDFKGIMMYTPSGPVEGYFYETLIDGEKFHQDIAIPLKSKKWKTLEDMKEIAGIEKIIRTSDTKTVLENLLIGFVLLKLPQEQDEADVLLLKIPTITERSINTPQIEFSVAGPQEAFVETLDTNIHLIRRRLPIEKLVVKQLKLGSLSQARVAVFYIDHIADDDNVETLIQRLEEVEYDQVLDSNMLGQMIQDNSYSLFPQFVNTERPDRTCAALAEGKVVFMVDGSPEAIQTPATLVEFFSSLEDYYLPWQIGTFVRLLRFAAVTFSIFATPTYVAVMTYHYEMIPKDLLTTLVASRSNIPFPPLIEALFLEFTIELLREAGARLPTKVGQTIGIVGGIVIGQASVQAGLTSNILLIIVALAALASFTTPVYQMGNTIRIIRFPFLILSFLFGGIGIALGVIYTTIHLLRLKSLGRPYLEPFYPLRFRDWKDAVIRSPFNRLSKRPVLLRPFKDFRMPLEKKNQKKDIDE